MRRPSATVGTVLGEGVGVAPKAKFISAAGVTSGAAPGGLLKSLQWMMAPTKVDGTSPDPSKAADVVGMSWWTGPVTEDLFLESMRNLRAAGIEPVKSAGNKGPGKQTISSPGQYPELISVAAVDQNSKIASFSSRGPAPYPAGSTTPKPDFAMPGVNVVSTVPGNRYGTMSGTSMAQPHMSGAILAVLSKFPQLSHDQLYEAFKAGATDTGTPGFDADYGFGVINLPKTLEAAAKIAAR
jgi:subtilisin family serine protease